MGFHDIKCPICDETLDNHSKLDALECLQESILKTEQLKQNNAKLEFVGEIPKKTRIEQ